jgi:hypothetical protein
LPDDCAHSFPPSDELPLSPTSPKYTTSPVPSGLATTGAEEMMPVAAKLHLKAPVVASSA